MHDGEVEHRRREPPPDAWPAGEAARLARLGSAAGPELLERFAEAESSLLTGYEDPPAGTEVPATLAWNRYFPGHLIAMVKPLSDGQVSYADGSPETEAQYARDVAALFETNHRERTVSPNLHEMFDKLIVHLDEPFADASALATYRLCELARERVKVALSGDGADEAFAGYRRYRMFAAEQRARRFLPGPLRRAAGALGAVYPKLDWAPRFLRAKTTLQALGQGGGGAYAAAVGVTPPAIRRRDRSPRRGPPRRPRRPRPPALAIADAGKEPRTAVRIGDGYS